ncbi:MAG: cadmium-translocating P-type ATPase [Clostridia bacterium]|nr:cadmium-translocating P-type ATPase [Clostridia bacterium]
MTAEKKYLLKGLDCPHCSARIELEVGALDGVSASSVNLMAQTLTITVEESAARGVEKKIKAIVRSHEPEVKVIPKEEDHYEEDEDPKLQIIRMVAGGLLFLFGLLLGGVLPTVGKLALFVAAYLILGYDVVWQAVRNLVRGRVFDENFLMSIASIGAFAIGEWAEAVAVMLFYQVGEFCQDMAVHRSRKSIAGLMDIRPDSALAWRNDTWQTLPPEEVSVGEVILVKPGEKIPLDGVVTEGESTLDTVALTGESMPRSAGVGDEVLSGCVNLTGALQVRVTKPFGESTVSKIMELVEHASGRKAPTEKFITTFARYYTPAVVILAALLMGIPPLVLGGGWAEWLRRGFVFLVVSCPCALVISIPLAFFGGIGAASRHGILIKGGNFLEALNKLDTVVFDKTGTLTEGVFAVSEVIPAPGVTDEELLYSAAFAEGLSSHPIATSILEAWGGEMDPAGYKSYREIPGKGICAEGDGKTILAGNASLLQEAGIELLHCDSIGTKVYVALNGRFLGTIRIADRVKPDSKKTIETLKQMGIRETVMLTGDNREIGEALGSQLGIDRVYAELLPQDKVQKLEEIDSQKPVGGKLAFLGDGINDAPVLARADVGIAMGGLGADAAIEAADVVLMTDEPAKLVEALEIARATRRIVIQNIVFALGIKGIFLLLGALGYAGMWVAVFGDVGVALLAVLNAMRIQKK